ncbi:Radical SAM domain protein [Methanohalobium evestigatum Z-7303]|uniref:FeMo cofactor biosynthesis protein NifB n=1 Tax=Methanohalobium evestigatum (strain ATCC BAA-1072 / DSM 3721 / NBRC 107634 / OCM 161 / Z-7303) TaxID=644295 RepID=D7E943_METEZ|nr:nitrogenase cofactor biosynthesis protein NifB [Methanohalobium evestigatum]ADI73991.1 Radical SAM domain protein [Methanohalobium evestigatum Z-7303]
MPVENSDNQSCPDYSNEQLRMISEHPCYDPKAQHKFGRMHLAVAPKCNIQCKYCIRDNDCVNECRPGVTSKVLTPQEALEKTRQVLEEHPFIKVIAIAGPGDPLANDETFETFKLIKEEFPNVIICMSTNGLALPDRIDDMLDAGVQTLTVTVNAVDPEIQRQICDRVVYNGKLYKGKEAAELLINNQLEGIKRAIEAGIVIKINTVLVPDVNDDHVVDIAKKMNELGVFIMNIMPLIPQAEYAEWRVPTEEERKAAQASCEPFVSQMRHCRQCRSDAYGLLGEDLSQMSEERRNMVKMETLRKSKTKSDKDKDD